MSVKFLLVAVFAANVAALPSNDVETIFDAKDQSALDDIFSSDYAPIIEPVGKPAYLAGNLSVASRPAVIVHGMGDASTNSGMKSICNTVSVKYPGTFVLCSKTVNGISSILIDMNTQVERFKKEIDSHPELSNGFNAVGLSQGNVLIEGYIAKYNDPPVHNFVSVCGPLQGVGTCPNNILYKLICPLWKVSPYGAGIAFSGYWKDVTNKEEYKQKSTFLADVLNERDEKDPQVKANFLSLNKMKLIEATQDSMVVPKESEQHGFWDWTSSRFNKKVIPMNETEGYKGDFIGLKTLDQQGKISFASYVGDHLRFSSAFWDAEVLPLLGPLA